MSEKERLIRSTLLKFNVYRRFLDSSFDNFIVDKENKEAYNKVLNFAKELVKGKRTKGLYIYGPTGVGKTHLASAVLRFFIENTLGKNPNEKENTAYFTSSYDYIRKLVDLFEFKKQFEFSKRVASVKLLVIDDLGAESLSPWSLDELFYLIYTRYNSGLPTVFTSNYDLAELYEMYTRKMPPIEVEKILSRIKGTTEGVKLTGIDRRGTKKT